MALLQPTNITPSSFSGLGAGTVDAAAPLTVSWQVNGNSAMVAYQIIIMQNDSASTQVHDSGKIALETPFYGVDYKGDAQFFSAELGTLEALKNGYENGYKLKIIQWWGEEDKVEQSQASFFLTRATPTLEIAAFDSPMSYRKYVFSANYSQEQGDSLTWFRWYVAQADGTVLKDTGNIYGTGDVRVEYDGFFTGESYQIRCVCQTENGVEIDTGWQSFSVQYEISTLVGYMTACPDQEHDSILVSWPAVTYIKGTASGEYSIEDGALTLGSDGSVVWNEINGEPMHLPVPWSLAWRGQMTDWVFKAWTVTGEGHTMHVEFDTDTLRLIQDGTVLVEISSVMSKQEWWTILLTPTMLYVRQDQFYGGLYPSKTLYPSATLFPRASKVHAVFFTEDLDYDKFAIEEIRVEGPQVCDYLFVVKGEIDPTHLIYEGQREIEYDDNTYFRADFNNELNAGNLFAQNDRIIGTSIYRMAVGETAMLHLTDLDLKTVRFLDYGVRNGESYVYYLFPRGEKTYVSEPLISNEAVALFWKWILLECEEDENGIFHMVDHFPFVGNIESGSITNNNTPTLLMNFTRYPTRQPSVQNYKSGLLRAVIGTIDRKTGKYADSVGLAERIWALSTSLKPKFLRDRKGHLYRVETQAPITMDASDGTREQVYTMSLPWCEVDSADDASILSVPGDAFWPLTSDGKRGW